MPSVFTRIINGELPANFVWSDDVCVAFLSINPLRAGHTLVVPRAEVDHWIDLDHQTVTHVMGVARVIGAAQQQALTPSRVGLMIAGFEVPHTHLHVVPIDAMPHLDFAQADTDPDQDDLDTVAELLRSTLRDRGHGTSVPD